MRKHLGAVQCDTDTAKLLASAGGVSLYRTKTGKFFIELGGGMNVITAAAARSWLTQTIGAEETEKLFTKEKLFRVSVDLPVSLIQKIDAARDKKCHSRKAVIEAALWKAFEE